MCDVWCVWKAASKTAKTVVLGYGFSTSVSWLYAWLCFAYSELPVAAVTPRRTSALPGAHVQLTCTASGHPTPTISWTRNGKPLETSLSTSQ